MRYVVFDLETQNTFSDVGSNDPADLSISVGCVYDSGTDTYTLALEHELNLLWPIIESADALVGYNSDHFDIPLLNKYYPGDLYTIPSIDILSSIRDAIGKRLKLDSIAQATLGTKKSGHGLQAIRWWRDGDIASLKKYCKQDVKITKDVFEFAREHKKLMYKDGSAKREIPINTDAWEHAEENRMTFSLPF